MTLRPVLVAALLAAALPAASALPPAVRGQEVAPPAAQRQTLRPGDIVRLRIWREPDMSGEFPVDENGMVVLPRLGEYQVLDFTPEALQARLVTDYRRYLINPSIEITVLRRVRIVGAVNNPGLFPVDPTVTVADALALAGGATVNGDPDKIRVIRDGVEVAVDIRVQTRIADSPIRSGDQIWVPERSWVSRNSGIVAAAITGAVSLVIALFLR